MGLVLTRRIGESVFVGEIKVTVARVKSGSVKLSFTGPEHVNIVREELLGYGEMETVEDNLTMDTEGPYEH